MKILSEITMKETEMLLAILEATLFAIAYIAAVVVRFVFVDELDPYWVRYLELGFTSLCLPACLCWAHSGTIRTLIRSIDEHDDGADPVLIKPKPTSCAQDDSSIAYVLGINTLKISGKVWAALLFIPYALAAALVIVLDPVPTIVLYPVPTTFVFDDAQLKLLFARRLSLLYMFLCYVALFSLQEIPIRRLMVKLRTLDQLKDKEKNSSSASIEPTTGSGLKQD